MTPEEKAKELFAKFMPDLLMVSGMDDETYAINKKFALICVDEIIKTFIDIDPKLSFWQEVKSELEKL